MCGELFVRLEFSLFWYRAVLYTYHVVSEEFKLRVWFVYVKAFG